MANTEVDLNVTCRGCLGENEEMHDLFAELEGNLKLADILERTTCFTVKEDDGLSHYMCEKCAAIVVDFYNFKLVFQETEEYIHLLLKKLKYEKLNNCIQHKSDNISEVEIVTDGKEEIKFENEDCNETCNDDSLENFLEPQIILSTKFTIKRGKLNEVKQIVKYSCHICTTGYSRRHRFKEHMYNKHNERITNYSKYSTKAFVTQSFGRVKECKENSAVACFTCDIQFETHEELCAHIKTHRNFICEQCGASFTKKSILSDHMEKHATTCRFICPFCGKGFRHRGPFSKHKKIHTNPGHAVCETCGKRFNDTTTLKTHIQLIHIRSRNFLCTNCGLSFPLRATLRKHQLRKHAGRRENHYKCQYCTMAYKDKSSLDRHITVKHDDSAPKPACHLCDKTYTTTTNLSKHMRKHHSGNAESVPQMVVADCPKEVPKVL